MIIVITGMFYYIIGWLDYKWNIVNIDEVVW